MLPLIISSSFSVMSLWFKQICSAGTCLLLLTSLLLLRECFADTALKVGQATCKLKRVHAGMLLLLFPPLFFQSVLLCCNSLLSVQ